MSGPKCRHFVQNAWKKELCSNCFKPREEHAPAGTGELRSGLAARNHAVLNVKRVAHKVQGILRPKDRGPILARSKRKNVAFPESLAEIIGYDGGDDFYSDPEDDDYEPSSGDDDAADSAGCGGGSSSLVDDLPDSEEERALGNLTRANTNFNTVTANLTADPPAGQPTGADPKLGNGAAARGVMLGRTQKDAEGRKTTLLVTVTPFGGDDNLPTARRPADKKPSPDLKSLKSSLVNSPPKPAEPAPTQKLAPKKLSLVAEPEKPSSEPVSKPSAPVASSLGKIVDMPLITSTNLITVMRAGTDETQRPSSTVILDQQKRPTSIARTPAIKKPENEKPRIVAQPLPPQQQQSAETKSSKQLTNGVELNLTPVRAVVNQVESAKFTKEIPGYKGTTSLADLAERKVEGEAASDKLRPFEESRESAGEPDGKADEEVITEPPALPKSPPPLDTTTSTTTSSSTSNSITTTSYKRLSAEPRTSFLHGTSADPTPPSSLNLTLSSGGAATTALGTRAAKPAVPQKPAGLPSPTRSIGSSLASLLSENRAYEFRLSQIQSLGHSQSESQLCPGADDKATRRPATQAESKPTTAAADTYKAVCVKTADKDEQTEEEPSDEDDSEASSGAEQPRKRQAPQPPDSAGLFARNPAATPKPADASSPPCVREKEKREQRASSCSPKFRKTDVADVAGISPGSAVREVPGPEPAPRRNISLSQDSLAAAAASGIVEEKKKARSKFSLKKFLRMGTRKDVDMTCPYGSRSDEIPTTPQPKPRLEIIHPLELDGAAVQVVRSEKSINEDTTDSKNESHSSSNSATPVHSPHHVTVRPSKPPPPPRAQSLDESSRPRTTPPPKQQQQQQQQQSSNGSGKSLVGKSWQPSNGSGSSSSGGSSASDSIYANLAAAPEDVAGAMRSGLAPAKPRRTSSMRDQPTGTHPTSASTTAATTATTAEAQAQPRQEPLVGTGIRPAVDRCRAQDSEFLTSSSSQASLSSMDRDDGCGPELRRQGSGNHPVFKRQSDSLALEPNSGELKFQQALFTRSTSLPYCASETDAEIYSPFSYYLGDESSEDSQDWKKDEDSRIGRLRQRRGRSIVHRSLEDNYGAVIVANHEALAQFLEQMNHQPQPLSAGLRALKTSRLSFQDFSIDLSTAVVAGRRTFLSAVWLDADRVTLCVAFEASVHASRKEFYLAPIVEFIDTVTDEVAGIGRTPGRKNLEATISVLPRLQVNTLKSFAESLAAENSGSKDEGASRESSFVLLQLVSALKSLQARGVEEAPANLSNVVLCREEKDACHRLYLFQGLNIDSYENNNEEACASLCQCALKGLEELELGKKLPLVRELLTREKAVTLSQVKSVLEFSLWGPSDATLGGPRERETALQRWLDLERATVLHALVRARARLTVTDEYQLLFLVRTSAKIMCEASLLLDRQRNGLLVR